MDPLTAIRTRLRRPATATVPQSLPSDERQERNSAGGYAFVIDDATEVGARLPFGRTDCALPMLHALETGRAYDTFVVYTDNETWAGDVHPHEALRRYRTETGIDARLVVVGMTSTGFSIADPTDAGSLDVVGFDAAVPTLIADFSRGL